MTAARDALDSLRQEIDSIDGAIHELLMKRAAVVRKVGQKKGADDAPIVRPAREATILRRVVNAHKGAFPAASLVRIWREIISASVAVQGTYGVAVPADDGRAYGLARSHFGDVASLSETRRPLEAVMAGRAAAVLMPVPVDGEAGSWWPVLARRRTRGDGVVVLWRLPFVDDGGPAYLVVGQGQPGDSGDDRTLIAVEPETFAGEEIVAALRIEPIRRIAQARGLWLLEAGRFVAGDDACLALPIEGIRNLHWMGAYPAPIELRR
jgi:chorismate mutase-like protein